MARKKSEPKKTVRVTWSGTIDFGLDIEAETLEEALAKAKEMKEYEVLKKFSESGECYDDYDIAVTNLWMTRG